MSDAAKSASKVSAEVFTLGDPVPMLDGREVMDYLQLMDNGLYFEPPISQMGLVKSFRANAHHASAIHLKQAILTSTFKPHRLLSRQDFSRWVLDYLILGNCYLENVENRLGGSVKLRPTPALQTRRMKEPDHYLWVKSWADTHQFKAGSVFHLLEPDPAQEIYGMPQYLAALNSAWLNESATLFRRKYYENGSHAGFILYLNDANLEQKDVDTIREQLKKSKGIGNFKNLFLSAPGGQKDGVQLIPISEVTAKDEFFNIKNVTRDDVLAAHRVPPPLMGIVPSNTGGFGSVEAASKVFVINELTALQQRFREVNDWIGEEVVDFEPYEVGVRDEGAPKVIPAG